MYNNSKTFFLQCFLLLLPVFSFASPTVPRDTTELKLWEYRLEDESAWKSVTIPHDFQMSLPWEEDAGGARGFKREETAYYRTTIKNSPEWEGKKVLLEFEGLGMQGEVFVNGKSVCKIDYGYLGCEADISSFLNKDYTSDNEILVRTYTGRQDGSRWYTGGGLFRPVRIVAANQIKIARHGLYITTPEVSRESATVKVQVEVEGFTGKDEELNIISELVSPDGKVLKTVSAQAPRRNYLSTIETPLPEITVQNPLLWSCETPSLYTMRVSLVKGDGTLTDRQEVPFGIRKIEFDKAFGFRLNGEKVFLKGIANHHDMGTLGAAAYEGAFERLILRLKEFGFNHIRTSHNPYPECLLRLADKYGILVVDELYDKWMTNGGGYWIAEEPFTDSWFRHEREWLKRDRNHPCVIAWSFGNETQINESWNGFPGTTDWGITTFRVMKTFAQRFDNTRPFTVAQYPARRGSINKNDNRYDTEVYAPELACETDFAALNYRFREYDKYLEHDPYLNIYQSEASTSNLAAPFFGMDYDKMIGLAYWGAVEYWGESDRWPKKGWNYSFFNSALEPYPQAYLIRSAFLPDEPLVHIAVVDGRSRRVEWNDILSGKTPMSENWNREQGSTPPVYTFTNADEVELFVNGKSLGVKKNDRSDIDKRNIIFWGDVPYDKGGSLTAVARTGGKEVARHTIETTGKAVALKAVLEPIDGELAYIRVYAVDRKGRVVRGESCPVGFEIKGSGEIVAIDNQDHYTDELFDVNPKNMKNGFVMAIVRRGEASGTLTATSEGKKSAIVEFGADTKKK